MCRVLLIFATLMAFSAAQKLSLSQIRDLLDRNMKLNLRTGYRDNSGQYIPDDSGKYVPDNLGSYVNQYRDDSGKYRTSFRSDTNLPYRKVISPVYPIAGKLNRGNEFNARILKFEKDQSIDGYRYLYQTENGINAEEQGRLENVGSENEVMRATGSFSYTGPDNVVYSIEYKADENGFQPTGAHLPK